MAAALTLAQLPRVRKSPITKSGVLALAGFGVRVIVRNGHLEIEDGVGMERRQFRLPRVAHGLKRLVVIGNDGIVSLAALRWLADQDASFSMLDRSGRVLMVTGPIRSADVKLRRVQALSHHSGAALSISRELIHRKLIGQERVAQEGFGDSNVANVISDFRLELAEAESLDAIRLIESRAARAYWSAWRNVPVNFAKKELPLVPDHWRKFGARVSPLTGSPRLAVNPPNAMLNVLYSLLEVEARLAANAIGLDPGLGVLHLDATSRESLALDLMEPVRPLVDAYVLNWLQTQRLTRQWFFEGRDGNCRLRDAFGSRLFQTIPTWRRAVEPIAEYAAQAFWSSSKTPRRERLLPTNLTQTTRRESHGGTIPVPEHPTRAPKLCERCGKPVRKPTASLCGECDRDRSREQMVAIAENGRALAHTEQARAKSSVSQSRHHAARSAWDPQTQPVWLSRDAYLTKVQPRLSTVPVSLVARVMQASMPYATDIRNGKRIPHPRHWHRLAEVSGACEAESRQVS